MRAAITPRLSITYSYCSEDILELVHQCDQPGVVHVNAMEPVNIRRCEGLAWACAYAFGFVAMAGETDIWVLREAGVWC